MKMTDIINQQVDNDQMVLISQYYPDIYTQLVPEQGEGKPKRRRKKNKSGSSSSTGLRKRKLTEEQSNHLELSFENEHKLESERKDKLASELGLDPRQVAVWFQNRRARWKSKKLEEEYSRLKMEHDSTVVEKCCLETEILKLKEKLCEAEKKIRRLTMEKSSCDGVSSNSPSNSSFSMEAATEQQQQQQSTYFLGGFDCDDVLFYMSQTNYGHGLDWTDNFYNM